MYNGIYFQSTLFRDGRLGTDSLKRVCPLHSSWGVMRGNVVHSNQRFGWYPGAFVGACTHAVKYMQDLQRRLLLSLGCTLAKGMKNHTEDGQPLYRSQPADND